MRNYLKPFLFPLNSREVCANQKHDRSNIKTNSLPKIIAKKRLEHVDLRIIGLAVVFAFFAVLFFLRLRYATRRSKVEKRIEQEREFFLANFNPSTFTDFDAFTFRLGDFSHVGPFPAKNDGGWIYTIFLTKQDTEDIYTISHEIVECTLGRLIERLLLLKSPLYLVRKQGDKFWLSGKHQKYILEHIVATLSELDTTTRKVLEERVAKEDIQAWQLKSAG